MILITRMNKMKKYNNVLITVSLTDQEDEQLIDRVINLLNPGYQIALIRVIETIGNLGQLINCGMKEGVLANTLALIREKIQKLRLRYRLPKKGCFIRVGNVKDVIIDVVTKLQSDLIALGNHYSFLWNGFNSITNQGLSDTFCDVLAIRVQNENEVG